MVVCRIVSRSGIFGDSQTRSNFILLSILPVTYMNIIIKESSYGFLKAIRKNLFGKYAYDKKISRWQVSILQASADLF